MKCYNFLCVELDPKDGIENCNRGEFGFHIPIKNCETRKRYNRIFPNKGKETRDKFFIERNKYYNRK
jgi:hypothetical protein